MQYYYSSFIHGLFVSFPWSKVTHVKPQGEGICITTHSITINCASFERGDHLSENHIDLTVSRQIYWKNKNKKGTIRIIRVQLNQDECNGCLKKGAESGGPGYLNIGSWSLFCWWRGPWTSGDRAGSSSMWNSAETSGFRSERQATGSDPKSLQRSKAINCWVFCCSREHLSANAIIFRAVIQRWLTTFDFIRMCASG